jgi:hypothetical protein
VIGSSLPFLHHFRTASTAQEVAHPGKGGGCRLPLPIVFLGPVLISWDPPCTV